MNFVRIVICLAVFGTTFVCRAETWTGRAGISFRGTSTLHDFHGHGEAEQFAAEIAESGPEGAAKLTCRAELKVGQLSTDNKSRDKSMYAMFRMADFPVVAGALNGIDVGAEVVPLVITVLGQEQTVRAGAANWKTDANLQSFTLEFDVSLAASGLKAPRAAAGLIRVGDVVHVTVQVELTNEREAIP